MVKATTTFLVINITIILFAGTAGANYYGGRNPAKIYLGLRLGPVLAWNQDLNNQHTISDIGFNAGAGIVSSLNCQYCRGLMLEAGFDYEHLGGFDFGPTRLSKPRAVGNYKESEYVLHANVGVRFYPVKGKKISPFVSLAPGIYYQKVSSVSFKDYSGRDLETGQVPRSHINFGFGIGAGISYRVSYRIILEFQPKWHVFFPRGPANSFIQFPLTLNYLF